MADSAESLMRPDKICLSIVRHRHKFMLLTWVLCRTQECEIAAPLAPFALTGLGEFYVRSPAVRARSRSTRLAAAKPKPAVTPITEPNPAQFKP